MKNIDRLRRFVPDAQERDWTRHPNGGGWIHREASVPSTAWVADTAICFAYANIGDHVNIGDHARIGGYARIGADTSIGDLVSIGGYVRIGDHAEWLTSPLQIQGSQDMLYVSEPGIIGVGCELHSPDWWLKHYRSVGRANGYTKLQISEYGMYLKIAVRWMRVNKCFESTEV